MPRPKQFDTSSPFTAEVLANISTMRKHTTFTTDQLWAKVILDKGRDPRAIGSALRMAVRLKLIEATGGYRKSMRAACHQRPVAVWKRI